MGLPSKTMNALLIDAEAGLISEVTLGQDYREISRAIKCDMFTATLVDGLAEMDRLYVDDVGLLVGKEYGFVIGRRLLAGNGIVIGCSELGESKDAQTQLLDLAMAVEFARINP